MKDYADRRRAGKRAAVVFGMLAALYVVSETAGTMIIRKLYIRDKLRDLQPIGAFTAQSILTGNLVPHIGTMIVKAYTIDGNEIDLGGGKPDIAGMKKPVSDGEIRASLAPYMSRSLSGLQSSEVVRLGHEKFKSLVCAVPVIDSGSVRGTVFMIQPLADLEKIIRSYVLVFTVTAAAGLAVMIVFMTKYIGETEKLEMMRREYISNVSHELRSPLSSVRALAETLSDGVVHEPSDVRRYYAIMLGECRRGEKLVQDMLELSRLESGKTAFAAEKLAPQDVLAEIGAKYSVTADDMGITFTADNVQSLPPVESCRDRLVQLFSIFIDNAVRYVPEDGGRIEAGAYEKGGRIVFFVKDNGCGIEKNLQPYIFERFRKGDSSHSEGGSGLGLAIARELCSRMGESVYFESEEGKGSTFFFTAKKA